MRLSVIGTGYLGATHAACMAELGHEVVGVDVDRRKIEALTAGRALLYEPGLREVLARNLKADRLRFSTDYARAAEHAEVHFVAVGTPQRRDSCAADVSHVRAVIERLVPLLEGEHLILGKSTVPVGTAAQLQELADSLARPGASVEIAWNPEFLREGHAVADTLRPDRLVLGLREGSAAESLVREVYAEPIAQGVPFLTMGLPTAELVKVSANAFLATKISFINAVSEVCEAAGADVTALARALGYDERIGGHYLGAGLGFGGGCLPKDIRAFVARAEELGVGQAATFLREVDAINHRRRERTVELVRRFCGPSLSGVRVCVLGAAFKPHSDDVRDSPALHVAGELHAAGARVTVYDPRAMDKARAVFPMLAYAPTAEGALQEAQVVILATEWPELCDLDPAAVARLVARRNLIDARNVLDLSRWREAGWDVYALGRAV
ncbi:UDP-glucose/GDP-mannose dehydrogenase family protein [Corynebacterium sp. zg-331]|uniref:UDP-glucose dehydrogenase family protein n=1 Tax=unclassified Corynebacterium TaxID=2624378 RepID=UPI00128D8C28|nr:MULTISPECIES: UDP-glucose/GDP-mannose dehydrogenase family protein [unclassified Corynebacterium]MBC3185812.1 UDP-glucose/GDP-mannose dehydrogenase family protein [Corynebacterium sp. zg-331]MPV52304.1 nucleotide sugar dehydrogenase [Corynebacterium sp. zg331]